jgi:hypothetical protein
MDRVFPRNLTALAALQVAGNPVNTRLESGVGNCYPGLEFDQRNLDRRFFPGLVFEFSSNTQAGAHLVEVDRADPDWSPLSFASNPADRPDTATQSALAAVLVGDTGDTLRQGSWFLASITQQGKTIFVQDEDGMVVWRLVRTLQPGPLTIRLERREGEGAKPRPIDLQGWRRTFTSSATGTLSPAYAPGEMTQSLCSPWMHDFRDCPCYYWASNHPDIVLAEDVPGRIDLARRRIGRSHEGQHADRLVALRPRARTHRSGVGRFQSEPAGADGPLRNQPALAGPLHRAARQGTTE